MIESILFEPRIGLYIPLLSRYKLFIFNITFSEIVILGRKSIQPQQWKGFSNLKFGWSSGTLAFFPPLFIYLSFSRLLCLNGWGGTDIFAPWALFVAFLSLSIWIYYWGSFMITPIFFHVFGLAFSVLSALA
ncbi:hypothetical protein BDN70DRAFT_67417 [Pholiota conissans]|uniref:Uncharacterized protein n=1 Tax=Pholiota conissans TaxID=109636 RepID=A0A9P5YYL4_9AGAR|nr:hypothetical protein BDN70DRAFT_67417 [Pholiota conissans]